MEEFNYNEIGKRAMAPNLLKSYGIDIEKGGQGSGRKKVSSGELSHYFEKHGSDEQSRNQFKGKEHHYSAHVSKNQFGGLSLEVKHKEKGHTSYSGPVHKDSYLYKKHEELIKDKESKVEKADENEIEKGGQGSGKKKLFKRGDKVMHERNGKGVVHHPVKGGVHVNFDNGKNETVAHEDLELHKNKVEASNINKSFEVLGVEVIEKGGQGSGRKIGQTKSGKDIYENASHESHENFTSEDHKEASKLHTKLASGLGRGADKKDEDKILNHGVQAGKHEKLSKEEKLHEENSKTLSDKELKKRGL